MEASKHWDHSIGSRLRETASHLFSALVELALVPLEAANPEVESWEETQPSCASAREEVAPGGAHSSPLKQSFLQRMGSELYQRWVVLPALLLGKHVDRKWGLMVKEASAWGNKWVLVLQTCFSWRCLGRPPAQGWRRRHFCYFCCESPLV